MCSKKEQSVPAFSCHPSPACGKEQLNQWNLSILQHFQLLLSPSCTVTVSGDPGGYGLMLRWADWPQVVRDPGHVLLKGRRGRALHVPADQHVNGLGNLKKMANISKQIQLSIWQLAFNYAASNQECTAFVRASITGPMLIHLVNLSSAWMCS